MDLIPPKQVIWPTSHSVSLINNLDATRPHIVLITTYREERPPHFAAPREGSYPLRFRSRLPLLEIRAVSLGSSRSSYSLTWRTYLGGNASRFFLFRLRLGWRFNHLFIRSPSRVLSLLVGLILSRSGIIFCLTHNLSFARESSVGSLPSTRFTDNSVSSATYSPALSVAFSGRLIRGCFCRGPSSESLNPMHPALSGLRDSEPLLLVAIGVIRARRLPLPSYPSRTLLG